MNFHRQNFWPTDELQCQTLPEEMSEQVQLHRAGRFRVRQPFRAIKLQLRNDRLRPGGGK